MSDLRRQIQQHYHAQELPAVKVEAILAEGRAPKAPEAKITELAPRRRMWRPLWAIAAVLLICVSIAVWWWPGGAAVSYAALPSRVLEIFATGPTLPMRSQIPEELRSWLLAKGAPADFQIPEKLRSLKSFGCEVIDVRGRPAYLTCFWAEKKPGVDEGALVHLLVARRGDFKDLPPVGTPRFQEMKDWSFAAWTDGDVVYTMAANAPMEKLRKFVVTSRQQGNAPLLVAGGSGSRFIAGHRRTFDFLQFGDQARLRD